MRGLPPEAAVHRVDRLPPAEEYAALLVEREDQWWRTWMAWRSGKRVQLPPPIEIERPGAIGRQQRRVLSPEEFGAHYQQMRGGDGQP